MYRNRSLWLTQLPGNDWVFITGDFFQKKSKKWSLRIWSRASRSLSRGHSVFLGVLWVFQCWGMGTELSLQMDYSTLDSCSESMTVSLLWILFIEKLCHEEERGKLKHVHHIREPGHSYVEEPVNIAEGIGGLKVRSNMSKILKYLCAVLCVMGQIKYFIQATKPICTLALCGVGVEVWQALMATKLSTLCDYKTAHCFPNPMWVISISFTVHIIYPFTHLSNGIGSYHTMAGFVSWA